MRQQLAHWSITVHIRKGQKCSKAEGVEIITVTHTHMHTEQGESLDASCASTPVRNINEEP